jgi:hypothetical protein
MHCSKKDSFLLMYIFILFIYTYFLHHSLHGEKNNVQCAGLQQNPTVHPHFLGCPLEDEPDYGKIE